MVNNYESTFEQIIRENKRISPRIVGKRLARVPRIIRDASHKKQLQKIIKSSAGPK